MNKKKIFIGVAWPYVNGDLHIGHLAGYLLPADITARFHRYIGDNVLMVSGSDCHGTPITVEAEKQNLTPEQVVNLYHPKDIELFKLYGISYDIYTKTTTENHKKVVQEMFIRWINNGYVTTGKSQQYFSEKEKRFLPDRYVEGDCPNCGSKEARSDQCENCGKVLNPGELINPKSKLTGSPVTFKETEHYYLDLPKLENFIKNYVKKNKLGWRPWVAKETVGWLDQGLEKRSITRDLDWGIEIPIDRLPKNLQIKNVENKRVYVWFEAVIGYLSASIEWAKETVRWHGFWYSDKDTDHYYFMGQDNLIFHTILWPAELYAAYGNKIHLPDFPVINHFLDFEGQKFSKSRGVTVDSTYIGKTYGVDQVRFYLSLIMPEHSTASFSWADFIETNNKVLIGTFANFINRVLSLAKDLSNFDESDIEISLVKNLEKLINGCRQNVYDCEFKKYAQSIINIADLGNKYLNVKSPWKLDKDSKEYKKTLTNALLIVLTLKTTIKPLTPKTFEKLGKMLNVDIKTWPKDKIIGFLKTYLVKVKITNPQPLFAKIDSKLAKIERAKLNLNNVISNKQQNGIVAGKIIKTDSHPNAKNLNIYQVDIGAKVLSIVCADTSLKVGQIVPVALPGVKILGEKIRRSKLKGVESEAMLCSAKELGIGNDHKKIYILSPHLRSRLGKSVYIN